MGLSLLVRVGSAVAEETGASQFNICKGRNVELYNRVNENLPATSVLSIIILASSGLETDAVLVDKNTVLDLLSGTTSEVTNTGYSRREITDSDLAIFSPDDVTDSVLITMPDQNFTAISSGDNWKKVVIAYDSDSGPDDNILPMTIHDFIVDPDGGGITIPLSLGFLEGS